MYFKYNSYSHYILGHHIVKLAAAGKQSNNIYSNSAARDLFVSLYTRGVAK